MWNRHECETPLSLVKLPSSQGTLCVLQLKTEIANLNPCLCAKPYASPLLLSSSDRPDRFFARFN
jgi:hypothetical protein